MEVTVVQDVLGLPETWANCVSDDVGEPPDLQGATIIDVFVSRNEITLYAIEAQGGEAVAVFVIEDQAMRRRIASALRPGADVLLALRAVI